MKRLAKVSFRLILLFALIWAGNPVYTQQVTKDKALIKAEHFIKKSGQGRRAPHKSPNFVLANNRDEFFVFNDETNGGYVIISGDERMPEIWGYSYDSRFDADNIPCNMKAWLEGYAEQVKYLRTHPKASATRRSTPERENVDPLLTCWFNQRSPYNNKCPEVVGKQCPTGCVATAMAQIMYYWQWPKQTTCVIPGYTSSALKIEMPDTPITTIDWDNILGEYTYHNYNQTQADAISTLMLLCGVSVEMNYTPDGSGSHLGDAARAFRKYFDYDDILEYVHRSANTEDWEQVIYDELNNKRPVLYGGSCYDGNAHAFVLDGYENGFFHINWGWGGLDAYVLMPYTEGWNEFIYFQDAIIGVRPASKDHPCRYAVLDNGTMTLYYDKKKYSHSGTILPHKEDWSNYAEQITECIIDESFANLKQRSLTNFFSKWKNMKSIKGMEYLSTSNTTDMSRMFYNCTSLTSLDVRGFNTSNVTNMSSMFYGCSGLTSLDVSGFDTSNVTDMSGMFYNCKSLTSLDVSDFNTNKVKNMYCMFPGCSGLTNLDVSSFNTANVTNMGYMFTACSGLTNLDVSGFNTSNVTNMRRTFCGCSGLTNLDVSSFNTANVTDMREMFAYSYGLTTIYADEEKWSTASVTQSGSMFSYCFSLVGGNGTAYDANYTDAEYARIDKSGQPGYFTWKDSETGIDLISVHSPERDGSWYTIDGRKLQGKPTQKGVYINNGTKVVIK